MRKLNVSFCVAQMLCKGARHGREPGLLFWAQGREQIQQKANAHGTQRRFHRDSPIYAQWNRIRLNPVRQEFLSRDAIRLVAGKKVGCAENGEELQTREFERHFDVGPVVANAVATLAPHIGRLSIRHKVKVPFRPSAKVYCAITQKRIPSRLNFVREGNDESLCVLTQALQVRIVVRNVTEFNIARVLDPSKNSPPSPPAGCPPHNLTSKRECRFAFKDPNDSHLCFKTIDLARKPLLGVERNCASTRQQKR